MESAIFLVLLLTGPVTASLLNVSFYPAELTLLEGTTKELSFHQYQDDLDSLLFEIDDEIAGTVGNATKIDNNNYTLLIRGNRLGRTDLRIHAGAGVSPGFPIAVLRNEDAVVSKLFNLFVGFMIISNTFIMGTQLNWDVIKDVIKRPVAPAIGLTCQFLLMPLIAWGWGTLLLPGMTNLQLSYFAVGCSPGGGGSNQWTVLLDGNLDISIAMTFCSNILALAFMPMWLLTVGQMVIAKDARVQIPFANLIVSLFILIIPSFVGILVRKYKPGVAETIGKYMKIVMGITVLILMTFGVYAIRFVFQLLTPKILVCGFLLPWTGFALAALAAWAFRQPVANIKTIAIETGIQNAGIAMTVLRFSLPQPDADLATVMPVASLLFTPLPLLILLIGMKIKECVDRRRSVSDVPTESTMDRTRTDLARSDTEMKTKH